MHRLARPAGALPAVGCTPRTPACCDTPIAAVPSRASSPSAPAVACLHNAPARGSRRGARAPPHPAAGTRAGGPRGRPGDRGGRRHRLRPAIGRLPRRGRHRDGLPRAADRRPDQRRARRTAPSCRSATTSTTAASLKRLPARRTPSPGAASSPSPTRRSATTSTSRRRPPAAPAAPPRTPMPPATSPTSAPPPAPPAAATTAGPRLLAPDLARLELRRTSAAAARPTLRASGSRPTWRRNTKPCTLAYWHIPLFSSGGRAAANSRPFFDAALQRPRRSRADRPRPHLRTLRAAEPDRGRRPPAASGSSSSAPAAPITRRCRRSLRTARCATRRRSGCC